MKYTEYEDAQAFLAVVRPALERDECINSLMLGICLRLEREPDAYGSRPYLATVESAGGLDLAAVMTPPHNLQLYAADDGEVAELEIVADALQADGWTVPGVLGRQGAAQAFAAAWSRRTGAPSRVGMRQGIYELRRVLHPAYPPGELRPAAIEDLDLAQRWALGFYREAMGGMPPGQSARQTDERVRNGILFFWFWVDRQPVSMATRARPTRHGEAVGMVYTPPERRRRGYATALVARLSQQILDEGKQFCTLYTDLANPTSNHIYQSVGYAKVAEVVEVRFSVDG